MSEALVFLLYLLAAQLLLVFLWSLARSLSAGAGKVPTRREQMFFVVYLLLGQAAILRAWKQLAIAWEEADPVFLADLVVIVHLGFVLAVLLLLVLILVGWLRGWSWVRHFWLRLGHLVAIEIVAGQAVVGIQCPLTTIEHELRGEFVAATLAQASPLGRFCHHVLYFPNTTMNVYWLLAYVLVALLVLLTWLLVPPRLPGRPMLHEEGKRSHSSNS